MNRTRFTIFLSVIAAYLLTVLIFLSNELLLKKNNDQSTSESQLNLNDDLQDNQNRFNPKYHKLWFFKSNKTATALLDIHHLPLFPKEDPFSDRIVNQLMYVPVNYDKNISEAHYKTLYIRDTTNQFYGVQLGTKNFEKCPVSTCKFVKDPNADLIIHKHNKPDKKRRPEQIHVAYMLESPFHLGNKTAKYDWTATYRRDSDIVGPYGKWVYYDERIRQQNQHVNYAENKTKLVAWFVSNCDARNLRLRTARALQELVQVDIYGKCGTLTCGRDKNEECMNALKRDYKFYLSFENSDCRDYVTEKFFYNGIESNLIPIVMGGRIEDYQYMAPERSFIHVDEFASIEHLAEYLKLLDADDVLYNSYFRWKGTGEFIDTHYWCRVCAMLHAPTPEPKYLSLYNTTIQEWWSGENICKTYDINIYKVL